MARESGKQGKASILVYVGEDGLVAPFPDGTTSTRYDIRTGRYSADGHKRRFDYVVADEYPESWFFADNLLKVLPEWRFRPQIVDGRPTGNYLIVTYHYCLGVDCFMVELMEFGKKLE